MTGLVFEMVLEKWVRFKLVENVMWDGEIDYLKKKVFNGEINSSKGKDMKKYKVVLELVSLIILVDVLV